MANKWVLGARIRTLPAAIAPVLVATAVAGNLWRPIQALLALVVSLALQVGVNFANDYSDGIRGTDDQRVGPIRLTASGLAKPKSVRNAALISFGVAAVAGFILAAQTSWWLIAVGALAIAAAWGYTGGKNPYGYRGLGEVSVFLFFGIVATVGTYFVQVESINLQIFIVSIPLGSLSCTILVANNLRDRALDKIAGKKTLAVRLGDRGARALYFSLLVAAHVFALFINLPFTAVTLLVLPITYSLMRVLFSGASGEALLPFLAKTAKMQLIFSALFALSLTF